MAKGEKSKVNIPMTAYAAHRQKQAGWWTGKLTANQRGIAQLIDRAHGVNPLERSGGRAMPEKAYSIQDRAQGNAAPVDPLRDNAATAAAKTKAWETRRAKYGKSGRSR
jgi:hypothetical protein